MGLDVNRFINIVDEEFICSICQDILEDPTVSKCEHIFCKPCIDEWLQKESLCPIDREPLLSSQLCEPTRFFRNLYFKLELKCNFELNGCEKVCNLKELYGHQNECKFNPNSEHNCEKGCGASMPGNEVISHNCIEYLVNINNNLKEENERNSKRESDLEKTIRDQNVKINELVNRLDEIMTNRYRTDIERAHELNREARIELTGKFKLQTCDNHENFLAELGANFLERKLGSTSFRILDITRDGVEFTFKEQSVFRTSIWKFKLGEEFEDIRLGGKKIKNMMVAEGNKLIQIQTDGNKTVKYIREFNEDELKVTSIVNNVTSIRVYKRVR